MDSETPEADAVEQAHQTEEYAEDQELPSESPLDADPADLADQQRVIPDDDSDERG